MPGQTESCVDVPIVNDNIPEDDEMFNVSVQTSSVIVTDDPLTCKLTITDDDRGQCTYTT